MYLTLLDIFVIVIYVAILLGIAYSRTTETEENDAETLGPPTTKRTLPWWAIGTSLIAANISAEQIIGMSGSAYAFGLAVASYEWVAALMLLVVGKYFFPIFLKNGVRTMPEFLGRRYGRRIQLTMASFWLLLYVFVNLTAILWLGATALHTITGLTLTASLILLALFAGNYAIYVGLKAVSVSDAIQVSVLVLGGLMIVYIAMVRISGGSGLDGFWSGLDVLYHQLPDHFHLILSPDNPYYKYAPGIAMVAGGMWIINLSYWGFNQYIIQRALTARSLREAQKGIVMAAALKLVIPVLVVLPGIAAAVLVGKLARPDAAYPQLMTLLPSGFLGFVFMALVAAIVSSMGSTLCSVATLFSRDILRAVKPDANDSLQGISGRFAAIVALLIAMACAEPLLGNVDQAFQYIQEFTGFLTPGVLVVFLFGMFWPRATEAGALCAAFGSVLLSLAFKLFWPALPFINRIGLVFALCLILGAAASLLFREQRKTSAVVIAGIDYTTGKFYNFASLGIVAILVTVYAMWW